MNRRWPGILISIVVLGGGGATASAPPASAAGVQTAAASPTAAPTPESTRTPTPTAPTMTPQVAASWTTPHRVGPAADCSSVVAGIDAANRYHIAAECGGSIRYSVSNPDGTFTTRTFPHPPNRQELDPQMAFEGDVVYLAYTRIAPGGGCGQDHLDVGVYYRRRTMPNGAWSSPVRIGVVDDGLQSFRESGGTLYATVQNQSDWHLYYETLKGTTYHRYPIPGGYGSVSLRVGTDGRARIAYQTQNGIVLGVFNGSGFSTSRITSPDYEEWGPVLVLDAHDKAHLLWTHSPPPGGCAGPGPSPKDGTYYATNTGGAWKAGRFTTLVGTTSLQVDDATGRVHALVGGDFGLRYFTKPASGPWTGSKLTSVPVSSPVIRLDPANGTLLVVYIRPSGAGGVGGIYVLTKP
jgi:hypothetical protein